MRTSRTRRTRMKVWLLAALSLGTLLSPGCAGAIQREIEVLFAADANPYLIRDSFLFSQSWGRALIRLFNH